MVSMAVRVASFEPITTLLTKWKLAMFPLCINIRRPYCQGWPIRKSKMEGGMEKKGGVIRRKEQSLIIITMTSVLIQLIIFHPLRIHRPRGAALFSLFCLFGIVAVASPFVKSIALLNCSRVVLWYSSKCVFVYACEDDF